VIKSEIEMMARNGRAESSKGISAPPLRTLRLCCEASLSGFQMDEVLYLRQARILQLSH